MKFSNKFTVRGETNRRSEQLSPPRFPIEIGTGEVVLSERRVTPDRRHPGLQSSELQVTAEEFEKLFEAYQQHK